MDSFIWLVTPIAIAFFGFVVVWVIMKVMSEQRSPGDDNGENPAEIPEEHS